MHNNGTCGADSSRSNCRTGCGKKRADFADCISASAKITCDVSVHLFNAFHYVRNTWKSEDAGYYLRIFSLLVPVMYMDMVTDGCLKGLGEHLWSMGFNIYWKRFSVLYCSILCCRNLLLTDISAFCFLRNFSISRSASGDSAESRKSEFFLFHSTKNVESRFPSLGINFTYKERQILRVSAHLPSYMPPTLCQHSGNAMAHTLPLLCQFYP